MVEEKPCTDLVLLPPLELIPMESLPTRRSQELARLKQERGYALNNAFFTPFFTLVIGPFAGMWGWGVFMAVTSYCPPLVIFILALGCVGLLTLFVYLLRESICDVRKYRQMAIPLQLKADAEAEMLLSGSAQHTNAQITDWNTVAEKAIQHDLGGRYLRALKKHREALSVRTAQIKKMVERIGAK